MTGASGFGAVLASGGEGACRLRGSDGFCFSRIFSFCCCSCFCFGCPLHGFAVEVAEGRVFGGALRVAHEGHEAGGDVGAGAYAVPTPCSRSLLRAGTTGTEPVGKSGSSATVGTSATMRPKAPVCGAGSLVTVSARRALRSSSALFRRMAGRSAPHIPRCVSLLMDLAFFSSEWCLSELRVSVLSASFSYAKNLPHEFTEGSLHSGV